MRKYLLTLTAVILSSTNPNTAVAQNITLKPGWNLIGISEKLPSGENVPLKQAIDKTKIEKLYSPSIGLVDTKYIEYYNSVFEPGKGYWVKVYDNVTEATISFPGIPATVDYSFVKPGWNLISFTSSISLKDLPNTLQKKSLILETMYNPQLGLIDAKYIQYYQGSVNPNYGYWVLVKKLILSATTKDGIVINFYADSESDTLPDDLKTNIENMTYAEFVSSISQLSLNNFNGELIVAVKDPNTEELEEIAPISIVNGNISSSLPSADEISNNINELLSRIGIYVYGVKPGSAPQILTGATVYYIDDNGNEVEIGTTDERGLVLSPENVNLRGKTIIVEHPDYGIMNITIPEDATNVYYVLLSQGEVSEDTYSEYEVTSITNSTERETSFWKGLSYKAALYYKELSVRVPFKLKAALGVKVYPDPESLKEAFENNNANAGFSFTAPIASISFVVKDARTNKILKGDSVKFENLFYRDDTHQSDLTAFYLGLSKGEGNAYQYAGIPVEDIIQKLNSDNSNQLAKLEIWYYKDGKWNLLTDKATIKKVTDLRNVDATAAKFLRRTDYYIDIPNVGIGKIYDGFYPIAVVYAERSVAQADVKIKVVDANTGNPIKNALVTVGSESYTTGEDGTVTAAISISGQGSLIPVAAVQPDYIREVTSIDPANIINNGYSYEVTLKLQKVPDYATITGEVIDKDTKAGVSNAEVELINPISLDIAQVSERNGIKGIEVGLDSMAKYTWYIRKKVEDEQTEELRGGLGYYPKVATNAWIKVKEGKGRDGNFVSFNDILQTLFAEIPGSIASNSTLIDTYGVSNTISGVFEIAVKVEHDIDGDGNPDYIEFAGDNLNTILNDDGSITYVSADADYGKKVGELKVTIDPEKLAESATNAADSGEVVYKIDNSYYELDKNGQVMLTETGDDAPESIEVSYANYDLGLGGGSAERAFRIEGWNTELQSTNSSLDWNVYITADIVDTSGKPIATVVLDKYGKWQKLPDIYGNMLPIEKVKEIFSNDNFLIKQVGKYGFENGQLKWTDNVITYTRLIKNLADDTIIRALNKTVGDIAKEVGISGDIENANKPIIADGVTIYLAPHIHYISKNTEKDVDIYLHTEGLTLKADKIQDVLTISDVAVNSISQIPSKAVTYTDRVGEFSFARVPYDFSKLGDTGYSLLRLYAERYDYFPSGYQVVPAFEKQESTYTVVHQILQMQQRKTYSLTLNIKLQTKDGELIEPTDEQLNGTQVTITGIKSNYGQPLTYTIGNGQLILSKQIPGVNGTLPTFPDVLEGQQNIIVSKEGYIPVVKTVNVNGNKIVDIVLQEAEKLAEYKPLISVNDITVDYENKAAVITGTIEDRDDGVSDTLKLSVLVNGEPQSANIYINNVEKTFTISFEPPKGRSEVQIVATNDKGTTTSGVVYIDYYPDYGNLKGTVSGCDIANGEAFVASLYDEEGNLVGMSVPETNDGVFYFLGVPVGKYKLAGTCYDLSGVAYNSNVISVEVKPGDVIDAGTLEVDKQLQAVEGSPIVEFILSEEDLPEGIEIKGGELVISSNFTGNTLNLTASVKNFDLGNDVSDRFAVVVNDVPLSVTQANFKDTDSDATTHDYTFIYELPISTLNPGINTVYLVAVNKNGEYDFSDDLYIVKETNEENLKTVNLEFVTNNNTPVNDDYFYVDIFNNNIPVSHILSEYDGNNNYISTRLEPGTYVMKIYSQNGEYLSTTATIEIDDNGTILWNSKPISDSDNDGYYEVNVKKYEENEVIVSQPPAIALNTQEIKVEVGMSKDVMVTVTDPDSDYVDVSISVGDENIAEVDYSDVNGVLTITGLQEGNTTITITVTDESGNTVSKTITVTVIPSSKPEESESPEETSTETGISYPPSPGISGELEYPPQVGDNQ